MPHSGSPINRVRRDDRVSLPLRRARSWRSSRDAAHGVDLPSPVPRLVRPPCRPRRSRAARLRQRRSYRNAGRRITPFTSSPAQRYNSLERRRSLMRPKPAVLPCARRLRLPQALDGVDRGCPITPARLDDDFVPGDTRRQQSPSAGASAARARYYTRAHDRALAPERGRPAVARCRPATKSLRAAGVMGQRGRRHRSLLARRRAPRAPVRLLHRATLAPACRCSADRRRMRCDRVAALRSDRVCSRRASASRRGRPGWPITNACTYSPRLRRRHLERRQDRRAREPIVGALDFSETPLRHRPCMIGQVACQLCVACPYARTSHVLDSTIAASRAADICSISMKGLSALSGDNMVHVSTGASSCLPSGSAVGSARPIPERIAVLFPLTAAQRSHVPTLGLRRLPTLVAAGPRSDAFTARGSCSTARRPSAVRSAGRVGSTRRAMPRASTLRPDREAAHARRRPMLRIGSSRTSDRNPTPRSPCERSEVAACCGPSSCFRRNTAPAVSEQAAHYTHPVAVRRRPVVIYLDAGAQPIEYLPLPREEPALGLRACVRFSGACIAAASSSDSAAPAAGPCRIMLPNQRGRQSAPSCDPRRSGRLARSRSGRRSLHDRDTAAAMRADQICVAAC